MGYSLKCQKREGIFDSLPIFVSKDTNLSSFKTNFKLFLRENILILIKCIDRRVLNE
jgi:hypothetical protein